MARKRYVISKETRARCRVLQLHPGDMNRFQRVSLDHFHYLLDVKSIDFSIYFRVDDDLVEFITPASFAHRYVKQVIAARNHEYTNIDICVELKDYKRFEMMINDVREKKINELLKRDPLLDARTIRSFINLSRASQMIVRGGLTPAVASQAKEAAGILVSNLLECEVAIGTLSRMIHADPTLYDHSAAVGMIAGVIARNLLGRSRAEAEIIIQGGLYHDVGKTCISQALLNKPGRFTTEEFEAMKEHTTLGSEEIFKAIEQGTVIDEHVARVALEHHEKFTGKGYPHGRQGRLEENPNGIHIFTRIVTIADVYSALLMKRVYKEAYDASEAVRIMKASAEDYDPEIFVPFEKSIHRTLTYYKVLEEKNQNRGRIFVLEPGQGISLSKTGHYK